MKVDINALTWILFFVASLLICFRQTVKAGWLALLVAYILALISSQITITGITWLLLTSMFLYLATSYLSGWKQAVSHIAFIICSILLFMHKLPGFHNLRIFDKIRFSPGSAPFTMYLNLDKPFIGFILFSCLGNVWYAEKTDGKVLFKAIVLPLAAIAFFCLGMGLLFHFVAWAPKFPSGSWIWLLNNLLLVAVSEEALFRGYLQGYIGRKFFSPEKYYIPLLITALLFGIMHMAGGPALMLMAFIAGIGYGFAYHKGGIMASVLTHFGFNLLHFLLFTYPMRG